MATNSKRRTRKKVGSKKGADASKYIGLLLIVLGVCACLYTFDIFPSISDVYTFDVSNVWGYWPLALILLGFIFVIKNYLKSSSAEKWDS